MDLRVDVSQRGAAAVLTLAGDIDLHTAPQLGTRLEELREAGRREIVLDLTDVEFLDSSALGLLVSVQRQLRDGDGDGRGDGAGLRIACPPPHAQKVFRITRLAEVIPIYDSVDAATG